MPQQKTITLYDFIELGEEVKKKLISEFELDHQWDDPVIQMIEQEAEDLGIIDFDVRYSGFWSQGDGLSFTGILSDTLLEKIYKESINRDGFGKDNPAFSVSFERVSGMYVHEKTTSAYIQDFSIDSYDSEHGDIVEDCYNNWKDKKCNEWYHLLRDCYEAQTSEEYIQEYYQDLGSVFLKDGRTL